MATDDSPLDPPEAAPEPAPAAEPGISAAEATQLMTDAQAPLLNQISQLADSIQAMSQVQSQSTPVEPQHEDFLTELTTGDPQAAIGRIVDQRVQQQLGSLSTFFANTARSGSDAFLSIEAQQVDATFGDGAWEKYIQAPMGVIMGEHGRSNPAALMDSALIHREVNGIKGELLDTLVTFRDASRSKAADSENASLAKLTDGITEAVRRTNGIGGLRRIEPGSGQIPEGLEGYLSERTQDIGKQPDAKQWLANTDYGNTIDDYREKEARLKAANGASH